MVAVGFSGGQVQIHPKGTALIGSTFDANVSAHQLGQLFRDSQSQPGSFQVSTGWTVDLFGFLKEFGLIVLGNTDAGVSDFESDAVLVFGLGSSFEHAENNPSGFGEFDGIPQQVGEDLADSTFVPL